MRRERAGVDVRYLAALLLALAMPFELVHLLARVGPLVFTNLEALVVLTAAIWAADWVWRLARQGSWDPLGGAGWLPRAALIPALLFLLLATISAQLAPEHRGEALKFVGRFGVGLYALVLVYTVSTTLARLRGLLWAVTIGAGVSAVCGLVEIAGGEPGAILSAFRLVPAYIGGDLRLSGTLSYATSAAMFYEMATPLAIALAATAGRTWTRVVASGLAAACAAAVPLTITRGGMLTLILTCGLLLVLARLQPRWRALGLPAGVALLALALGIGAWAARSDLVGPRLLNEGDDTWYHAAYLAPEALTLSFGQQRTVSVEVRNRGQVRWTAQGQHPYMLGYRWLSEDGRVMVVPGSTFVPLQHDVEPGASARFEIVLEPRLAPGRYRLAWGMLQEGILTFRQRNAPDATTAVSIVAEPGAAVGALAPSPSGSSDDWAPFPPVVSRVDLWIAALRMFAERPLLGYGPDTYRHRYGPYLGLTSWGLHLPAHNLYLELLATLGLLGSAAFGWLLFTVGAGLLRALRRRPGSAGTLLAAGLTASLLAFLIHGLVDYFLEFTPLYLLFWVTLGLALALALIETAASGGEVNGTAERPTPEPPTAQS